MPYVSYTDHNGFSYVVEVPANTDPIFYPLAPHIGPPDLSTLKMSQAMIREIHNALVQAMLLQAPDMNTSRAKAKVLDIIKRVTGKTGDEARSLLRQLVILYQRDYYIAGDD